jgi:hypothetical protein
MLPIGIMTSWGMAVNDRKSQPHRRRFQPNIREATAPDITFEQLQESGVNNCENRNPWSALQMGIRLRLAVFVHAAERSSTTRCHRCQLFSHHRDWYHDTDPVRKEREEEAAGTK